MDELEQRAFSGARMAGDEQHFALCDLEADIGQRDMPAGVLLADVVEAQDAHRAEFGFVGDRDRAILPAVLAWDADTCSIRPQPIKPGVCAANTPAFDEPTRALHMRRSRTRLQCWLLGERVTSDFSPRPRRESRDCLVSGDAAGCGVDACRNAGTREAGVGSSREGEEPPAASPSMRIPPR